MTKYDRQLRGTRSSTEQFLVYKTESRVKDDRIIRKSPVGLEELTKIIPGIPTGQIFLDQAIDRMKQETRFAVFAIKIDNFIRKDGVPGKQFATELLIDASETIDTVCKTENGTWGITNNYFGCFFPGGDKESSNRLSENMREFISKKRKETLSIGIALYPALDFKDERIFDNARKALDHAGFLGPDSIVFFNAISLNVSGDKLYQKGDINGAVKEFEAARSIDPSNVNIHNSLGVCYGVLGQNEKALDEFEAAASLDPDEIMASYNAGLINHLAKNREKALEYYLKAHESGEDVFEVLFQTGKVYLETGNPEQAGVFLEKAARIRPESGPVFRSLGECYLAVRKPSKAIMSYRKAVKQNPNDAASLSALGCLFDSIGENPEIAVLFCEHSVEITPDNGLFRHRLGNVYLNQKKFDEALAEFTRATKLGHDSREQIEMIHSRITARAS